MGKLTAKIPNLNVLMHISSREEWDQVRIAGKRKILISGSAIWALLGVALVFSVGLFDNLKHISKLWTSDFFLRLVLVLLFSSVSGLVLRLWEWSFYENNFLHKGTIRGRIIKYICINVLYSIAISTILVLAEWNLVDIPRDWPYLLSIIMGAGIIFTLVVWLKNKANLKRKGIA